MKRIDIVLGEVMGSKATELRRKHEIFGQLAQCPDDFSQGPLAGFDDLHGLARKRRAFWRSVGAADTSLDSLYANFELLADRLAKADLVRVWANGRVDEQIFLVAMVAFLRNIGFPEGQTEIVHVPTGPDWLPTGALPAEDLEKFREPVVLVGQLAACYHEAWIGLISDTPEALFKFAPEVPSEMPLGPALWQYLRRYPEIDSGLGTIERALLEEIPKDWIGFAHIISSVLLKQGLDSVGDRILARRLRDLAELSNARLPVEYSEPSMSFETGGVRITKFGEACLAGRANHVLTNGIDQRIGGVHLSSETGNVWFREGAGIVRA